MNAYVGVIVARHGLETLHDAESSKNGKSFVLLKIGTPRSFFCRVTRIEEWHIRSLWLCNRGYM